MTKFGAWARKHLVCGPGRKKQSTDQPPFLPSKRRPITPTSLVAPTCLFFQLPYDVRSIILFMAFGGRTFHVDIVHHEGNWQWRGGVCIRNCTRHGTARPSMRYGWRGPWGCSCIQRIERTGTISNAHSIGIMGFLLSCKQAYTEGIDILYSANCINIKTERLLLDLPKFIPHNRLASITSIEITIQAHDVEQENGRVSLKLDHLEPVLDNIVTYCRHLRGICLSFFLWQHHGHDVLDGPALSLLDAFWESTQLRNMRVELPTRDYWAVETSDLLLDHPREAPVKRFFGRSHWRSLDSEEPSVQDRSIERYPYPPLKLPVLEDGDESEESSGYWLSEGYVGPNPAYSNCGEPAL
ncbi:hypothetical protein SNOG_13728 [Parastagonospora nodorum SN15]|uniref:DUF7730 domain-containing protein n=2 Tax=Phaeosphaeria nodorum (strain SN15 / ATCC MYA-4574 / FGSC 10173) TaxID=321614 RepID=Q0U3D6_PHANO|nr:hypothetical protein SNOG_13728 [Parastagonospora nodorum SN15]EAT78752.1 hypothetical protein SNOG_13728 [Parastagonospora nodorum SN15]